MKITFNYIHFITGFCITFAVLAVPVTLDAQRKGERPAGKKDRSAVSKPAGTSGKAATREAQKPSTNVNNPGSKGTGTKKSNQAGTKQGDTKVSTDKTNVSGNNVNVNNSKSNVNIDNSKNVNVNNSRTTVVVANPRPYTAPPYAYGGHRYYAYHPYHYHPYHPYYWGPVWHPWGFFVATIAATAIIVTVANQQYHYDQGVYYVASSGGYTVVPAPVGATIVTLPPGSQTVVINETTNNYYYGGTYYEKTGAGYKVVPPTAGSVVENLPEGGKEEKIGEVTYVKVGETYYQPITKDGKNMYEVVAVKDGEK